MVQITEFGLSEEARVNRKMKQAVLCSYSIFYVLHLIDGIHEGVYTRRHDQIIVVIHENS